jgi:Neuraminidase (sialidase)
MRCLLFFLIINTLIFHLWAQPTSVPVFVSGSEGHKSYRIPAIIRLNNGDLLAFAEGRVNGAGDFGDINIVLKRSKDVGQTWSPLLTVVDYDKLQAGNPAPVLDLLDPKYPKGRIFLFYNTGNNNEGEVRRGNGLREVWYKTSADEGRSWSEPVNITLQVHQPNQPKVNPLYNFKDDWRHYANTPGHALQINSLPYKGRIYVAANHSEGALEKNNDEGTILNIGRKKRKEVLAFCNAADPNERNNLTLRISADEGLTWPLSYPVDKNPGNKKSSYTAYSDIVKISRHKIGVLYEKDNYSQIVFKVVK